MALITIADPQARRVTPEALGETFEALLAEADLPGFLKLVGIGRFSLKRRRDMEVLFSALCIGMWRLAMSSALPDMGEAAYMRYRDSLWARMKDADTFVVLISDIMAHLPEHGKDDFTPTARELLRRADCPENQTALVGLALFLRHLYEYFFNHLL